MVLGLTFKVFCPTIQLMELSLFSTHFPMVLPFSLLTKDYAGALVRKLSHLELDKYYTILLVIEKSGEEFTQQKLAHFLNIDKTSVVRIIDYLTERGYVIRQKNNLDRREHFLVLTDKANAILPDINAAVKQLNDIVFENFKEEEQKQFLEALQKISRNLSHLPVESLIVNVERV